MKPDRRWHLIQFKYQEYNIVKTFEFFRRHNIEPILIKGWAAARNYPNREERVFVDTDICVAPADFRKALKVLETDGAQNQLIDLHEGLRHLDTVDWKDLFDNSESVKIGETDVRVLRPEDHLRILCVHWLNDGGAYKERLRDIFYAVENRPPDFDWNRCLDVVDKKRRRWIICAVGLAHRYLGLDLRGTPIAAEALSIPKWVIKTIENEWSEEIRLKPLSDCLSDGKELLRQLKKRFPPNAIQATIETGGEFDEKTRIFYQIRDIFIRAKPWARKFVKSIFPS